MRWLVAHGFAEVGPDHVTLLVDSSEDVAKIDKAKAKQDLAEAEKAMAAAEPGSEPHKLALRRVELARARIAA